MPRRITRHPERQSGRPTKCTPAVTGKIISAVRKGAHLEAAAQAAGVHPSTVYRWLQLGEDVDIESEYREFYEAFTRARAKAELTMVKAVVTDASGGAVIRHLTRTWRNGTVEEEYQYAPPNGRVALDYLARVHPDRWGRRPVEVGGIDGAPIQVEQRSVVIAVLADRLHTVLQGQLEPGDGDADEDAGDESAAS
jgi:transposase-like protein